MYNVYVITDKGRELAFSCETAEEKDERIRKLIISRSEHGRVFVEYEEVEDE
jgi:hypothetical protein